MAGKYSASAAQRHQTSGTQNLQRPERWAGKTGQSIKRGHRGVREQLARQ